MSRLTSHSTTAFAIVLAVVVTLLPARAQRAAPAPPSRLDLGRQLAAGTLRAVNRDVTLLQGPDRPDAVHVSARTDNGVVWIEGSDFAEGTISVDVRGKDVLQQSFLGVAFHRTSDDAYEAVYVRPFNFRAADPARHQHAVQYISLPAYDWPRLREQFPEEFENPVDASIDPIGWVSLRLVVAGARLQIFVGPGTAPALEVRKLGMASHGQIGLWVGNNSDGDFAGLRAEPAVAGAGGRASR